GHVLDVRLAGLVVVRQKDDGATLEPSLDALRGHLAELAGAAGVGRRRQVEPPQALDILFALADVDDRVAWGRQQFGVAVEERLDALHVPLPPVRLAGVRLALAESLGLETHGPVRQLPVLASVVVLGDDAAEAPLPVLRRRRGWSLAG